MTRDQLQAARTYVKSGGHVTEAMALGWLEDIEGLLRQIEYLERPPPNRSSPGEGGWE